MALNNMKSTAKRLLAAIVAVAVLMTMLSACGLLGGRGSGGGLGDVVVVGDGGSSAPGSTSPSGLKSPSGSVDGSDGDDDYGSSGSADGGDYGTSGVMGGEDPQADPFDELQPWTGTWVSNHTYIGTMKLTQAGDAVTGRISRKGYTVGTTIDSTISGTVSENTLTATAYRDDVPGYDHDVDGYEFRFVMSDDGMDANVEEWESESIFGGKSADGNGQWVWSYPYFTATRVPLTQPPPDGRIDPKLVGVWQRTYSRFPWQTDRLSEFANYAFYENGTFKHTYTLTLDTFEGKYSASGGKLYLTDISGYRGLANDPAYVHQRGDTVIEYEFGTDEEGRAYLLIFNMSDTINTYLPISGAQNFYVFTP